jgi:hypothetical protein
MANTPKEEWAGLYCVLVPVWNNPAGLSLMRINRVPLLVALQSKQFVP